MNNCSFDTLNFTQFPYLGDPHLIKTLDGVDYAKIVFISLVIVGTILGNVGVIVVVALNKYMRTTINICIVNLAVADLLVCSICMTSFLSRTLHTDHVYILGPLMCKAEYFCQMTFLTSSVLTLSSIACDRFIAVLFPFRTRITKQRTKLVISAVWLISIAASVPVIFVRKHYSLLFSNFVQPVCGDNWPATWDANEGRCVRPMWLPRFYYTFVATTLFFLPVTIMAVTYSLILWRLSGSVPGETTEANDNAQDRSRKKVIKMVCIVLVVFVFCWMPLQVVLLYDKYRMGQGALPDGFLEVSRAAEFLAYSNSFLNPIIYGVFNKSFRDKLCLLLHCERRSRRFGTPQFLQRFRLTLTTALSTSTKKSSGTRGRKESAVPCQGAVNPIENSKAVAPHDCAEEVNDVVREPNNGGKDTFV